VLYLEMIGAGNGGAGGQCSDIGVQATGEYGGGGGGWLTDTNLVSAHSTAGGTITVTIGAGGAGGAGTSTGGASGADGAFGGVTSFGSVTLARSGFAFYAPTAPVSCYLQVRRPVGSFPGTAESGTLTAAAYEVGNTTITAIVFNVAIGGGGINGLTEADGRSGIDSDLNGGGGGGGGGITTAEGTKRGGKGGKRFGFTGAHIASDRFLTFGNGASAGTAGAGAGGTAIGSGGGGGGSSTTAAGGAGGAGNLGGGGGGGGSSRNTFTSGAGGAGGSGRVRVWVIG